jgi:hypothetical protein
MRGGLLVVAAVAASAALVVAYLAAGGSDYEPTPSADPCAERAWGSPDGLDEAAEQFLLSALDGGACELGISREQLAVGLATPEARAELAEEIGVTDAELEEAVRAGVIRAIDDAETAGALPSFVADGMRTAAENLPVDETIALIEDAGALFDDAEGILGGLLDQAGQLVP